MMKSIEERARKYGEQKVGWSLSKSFDEQSALPVIAEKYETEYKSIAEEQQKVDIEKAKQWLKENVDNYLYNTGGFDEYIPKCGDKMFNDFEKAMKEE